MPCMQSQAMPLWAQKFPLSQKCVLSQNWTEKMNKQDERTVSDSQILSLLIEFLSLSLFDWEQ